MNLRTNWTVDEVKNIYQLPLLELIFKATDVHKNYHTVGEVQLCTLQSIKTGGCTEDCSYCSQSVKYNTDIEVEALMKKDKILEKARVAKNNGSTRFCMGAAWREIRDNSDFDNILDVVSEVNNLGMEVCCTLGMLTENQAQRLADAGLHAYNHNLDTSEKHYKSIVTTHSYDERLQTLAHVRNAGITICCGGIIGMGETSEDRIQLLHRLATLPKHPESVPMNALMPIEGTPLAKQSKVNVWDMLRMIASARILMPASMIRLSAGRIEMSMAEQSLCFIAGANSIFSGEKLLTTKNTDVCDDEVIFKILGLKSLAPINKKNPVTDIVE